MKHPVWLIWLFGSWLLAVACNDGRSNSSDPDIKEGHTAHQQSPPEKENMSGMAGMEDRQMNAGDTSLLSVVAATNKVVLSDQHSVAVRVTDTVISVRGYGYVTWDVRRNRKIVTRTGGRVEQLFVKYNYQYVRKGQKILNLYTPEINTYAAEYLHHVQTPGDEVLRSKAKEKLKLLGVTEGQIRQLEATGRINNVLSVYSNASGYTLFDAGNSSMPPAMSGGAAAGGMGSDMNGGSNPAQAAFSGATTALQLREGMYVNRGQTLFYVNDFAVVWGVLSFDESAQPLLHKGMSVVVKSELLHLPVRSTIAFIEPAFDNTSQKFMQVRLYLTNAGQRFRINSLIEGKVDVPLLQRIIIPAASVFSLGKRKIVWVKTGTTPSGSNIFQARDVQVSLMNQQVAVVTAGLSTGEAVAADAGYLLDSQSLIEQ